MMTSSMISLSIRCLSTSWYRVVVLDAVGGIAGVLIGEGVGLAWLNISSNIWLMSAAAASHGVTGVG